MAYINGNRPTKRFGVIVVDYAVKGPRLFVLPEVRAHDPSDASTRAVARIKKENPDIKMTLAVHSVYKGVMKRVDR